MAKSYELEQLYTQQAWAKQLESIELFKKASGLIGASNDDELRRYAGDRELYCRFIQGQVFTSYDQPEC